MPLVKKYSRSKRQPEPLPEVFIASSGQNVGLVYDVQRNIEEIADVTPWVRGFPPSSIILDELIKIAARSDFGIFIFAPDDATKIKGKKLKSVRDNVIFEAGLFTGKLGRERCFVIVPKGQQDLRIPTDLDGLILLDFKPSQADTRAALGPACNDIKKAIQDLGFYDKERVSNLSKKVRAAPKSAQKISVPQKIRELIVSF